MVGMMISSVGFSDKDKRGSLHDGRTGADEAHVGILHLPGARASGSLQRALDDVPQAMDTPGTETAAEGVERQFPVEFDAAVLYEVECLAFLAEAVRFQPVNHRS